MADDLWLHFKPLGPIHKNNQIDESMSVAIAVRRSTYKVNQIHLESFPFHRHDSDDNKCNPNPPKGSFIHSQLQNVRHFSLNSSSTPSLIISDLDYRAVPKNTRSEPIFRDAQRSISFFFLRWWGNEGQRAKECHLK